MTSTYFSVLLVPNDIPLYSYLSLLISLLLSLKHPPPHTPSQCRFLTPWSAFNSPWPHVLLRLSFCGSCACNTALSIPPHLGKHAHITQHSVLVTLFKRNYWSRLVKIDFLLNIHCSQLIFTKPLLVPLCLYTCSQGQCLACSGPLPSFPHGLVHSVCSITECILHLWISGRHRWGMRTGRDHRDEHIQTLLSTAKKTRHRRGEICHHRQRGGLDVLLEHRSPALEFRTDSNMPHCFPWWWRVGKENLTWREGWFMFCFLFVVLS